MRWLSKAVVPACYLGRHCCAACPGSECWLPLPTIPLQGAFKRVAADVEALGHELAALLRKRLLAAPDQAGSGCLPA